MDERVTDIPTVEAPQVSPPDVSPPDPVDASQPTPPVEAPELSDDPEGGELYEAPQEVPPLWEYLQEQYQPGQLQALSQELAWAYLKDDAGNVSLDTVQTIIDELTDTPGSVLAADVVGIIDAIQNGKIDPSAINRELEGYDQYRQLQNQTYELKYTQEAHERGQQVQQFVVSYNLPAQINSVVEKFNLCPCDNDSRLSAEFKRSFQDRLPFEIDRFAASNPHLQAVQEALREASTPGRGPTMVQLEKDSVFQISLQRGLRELHEYIRKTVAKEAYLHKLLLAGHAALNPQPESESKSHNG